MRFWTVLLFEIESEPCAKAVLLGAAHQLDARLRRFHQAAIGGKVVERHAPGGEACLELLATDAVAGIQDMGAAGLTCSTCEMASRGGTI